MKPGRELDALIAEKVMGWKPSGLLGKDHRLAVKEFYEPPRYSTDISAAWEVVEKLDLLATGCLQKNVNGAWAVWNDEAIELGESAPHAICLAALKAVT